jgi:NitT/TauT family transport system permease protein
MTIQKNILKKKSAVAIAHFVLSLGILVVFYAAIRQGVGLVYPNVAVFLPSVPRLLSAFAELCASTELWQNLGITSGRIALSICLTVATGIPVGLLIGSISWLHRLIRPAWDFLRSIPPSALFPLLVLILGIGVVSKVATTWFTTSLIYALGVADATRATEEDRGRFYKLIGVKRTHWLLVVLLPEAVLRSVSSLRIVVSITVALMLVCEMFLGAVDGFGGMLIDFTEALRYADLLGAIAITGLLGYLLNLCVDSLERLAKRQMQSRENDAKGGKIS